MISKITGKLRKVYEEEISLEVNHLEYQVLLPEFVRRHVGQRVGEEVSLYTMEYIEGNPMQGRLVPRLVGFLSEVEREFFEVFCSVDGVGIKKALKAMVRPIKEVAVAIQQQDRTALASLPGIGEATAERIIAKLRRRVAKFALMVQSPASAAGTQLVAEPTVVEDAYNALMSVGHSETEARSLLDQVLSSGKRPKSAVDVLDEIYRQHHPG